MQNKYYITTALPYVNADPHIGFAAEIVRADVLARWARYKGKDVFFNTGTDEHGLKIYRKAKENNKDPQAYVDEYASKFDNLKKALDLSYDNFIRTTDKNHKRLAQKFWKKCEVNGDIYKKNYKVNYCVGCELELTESELVDGKCLHHPNQELELIEEENYFFRWSKYAGKLLAMYDERPDFIVPTHRMNEIRAFIERGLRDFSISRLKSKMPWGINVPGDDDHVMYVWFDALTNYINCLDWDKSDKFKDFWPGVQVAGKDNLRQQTAMWQAMLMSAGLPVSKQVLIFGFINSDGKKMSKSIGNVINPYDLVEKYGTDATRYYLLAGPKAFEDTDYTKEKFEARYQADLANGLGNLVARVSNMLEKNKIETDIHPGSDKDLQEMFEVEMKKYSFDGALKVLWNEIGDLDQYLSVKVPWKMDDLEEIEKVLVPTAQSILNIADLLQIFLPTTAKNIIKQFSEKQIKKGEPLFPRLN